MRESDLVLLTRAGPEIGVASTKAFTTQIAALSLLVIALAKTAWHGCRAASAGWCTRLVELPGLIEKTLALDAADPRAGEALRRQAARAVPGPRRAVSRSRWKAR